MGLYLISTAPPHRCSNAWEPIRLRPLRDRARIMAPRFSSAADMVHLLPPDALVLLARYAAHPVVDVLWTSRRWRSRWAAANDWHADREDRLDALVRDGMPAHVKGATIVDDFVSLELDVDEAILPRTSEARQFKLHLTLGFASDYWTGIAFDAVARINARWRGHNVVFKIGRWTSGGTVELSEDDDIANDPDVHWLRSRGCYGNGVHVDPRHLHVSL